MLARPVNGVDMFGAPYKEVQGPDSQIKIPKNLRPRGSLGLMLVSIFHLRG